MKRKLLAFILIPFLIFYLLHIPYEIKKFFKYGHADFHNPLEVLGGFMIGGLMILPFLVFILAGYLIGFILFVKLTNKLKLSKFKEFILIGFLIGALGYIPFLMIPDSLSNWPWSIFYCTSYSVLFWVFMYVKVPSSKT